MVDLPDDLVDRAFLIAWSPDRRRMLGRAQHHHLLNAAVLVDLWLGGRLTEVQGRPVVSRTNGRVPRGGLAPEREAALARIEASKPRPWKTWVRRDARGTRRTVVVRLERSRVVQREERRVLGIPVRRVVVRDPAVAQELVARCRRAVLDGTPADQVDVRDAALVALAAATELNTVFTGRERRAHRERIAALATRTGPAAKALRTVVESDAAAAASSG